MKHQRICRTKDHQTPQDCGHNLQRTEQCSLRKEKREWLTSGPTEVKHCDLVTMRQVHEAPPCLRESILPKLQRPQLCPQSGQGKNATRLRRTSLESIIQKRVPSRSIFLLSVGVPVSRNASSVNRFLETTESWRKEGPRIGTDKLQGGLSISLCRINTYLWYGRNTLAVSPSMIQRVSKIYLRTDSLSVSASFA